jgi:F-type H+-transporting ATPase subunit b
MVLDPLAQLRLDAVCAVVAISLVTFALLRRVFFAPLLTVMERRGRRIEAATAARAEAQRLLDEARSRAEALLAGARDDAERLLDAARAEGARAREAAVGRATAEARALLAAAREEALALERAARARFEEELCACVAEVVERVSGRADEPTVRLLVRRALAAKEAP